MHQSSLEINVLYQPFPIFPASMVCRIQPGARCRKKGGDWYSAVVIRGAGEENFPSAIPKHVKQHGITITK
jgi:hypothetical protein